MLRTYLNVALRNLAKNKLIAFINIFGLALSMSVGLMILIRFQDALSYDKFHEKGKRILRITSDYQKKQDRLWHMASTPLPLGNELARSGNSIESIVTVYPAFGGKATAGGKELNLDGVFTTSAFFSIFDFPLLYGDFKTVLDKPNSIVLNKAAAIRFFGNCQVVGKMLTMNNGVNYIVTGVMDEPAGKSHLSFDAYVSLGSVPLLEKSKLMEPRQDDWFAFNAGYTYVLLKENAEIKSLSGDLNRIASKLNHINRDGTAAFGLQSLHKISPGGDYYDNDNARGNSWSKIYTEATVAILILLAACFNYTNLTIARALTRAKEVGMRKISGAKRYQIYLQYLFESVVVAFIALLFASIIIDLIVTYAPFNDGYEFIPSSFNLNTAFIGGAIGYALLTGIIAGAAPARILSSFAPLRVLKNLQTAKIFGKISLQKSLIVFQYSLSLIIIIFLSVFYQQFAFLSSADPGFRRDHTMIIPITGLDESLVINQVKQVSGVQSAAAFSGQFNGRFNGQTLPVWTTDDTKRQNLNYYFADRNFIPQMNLVLVAGNQFPLTDNPINESVLLNETAVRALGFASPEQAIGQKLHVNDSTQLNIAGVLKDFSYERTGRPVSPLALRTRAHAYQFLYVQTATTTKPEIQQRIGDHLSALYPNQVFSYDWLDESLEKSNSQTATISLLGYLGAITMLVASLGLLGLVIYTVEVKSKEISIRKVVGASERQLVKILSTGFVKLLLLSGLIAMPLGWILAQLFLQNFPLRINFSFGKLLACFLFLFSIGLFTIISQTWRAAVANPAGKLKAD
ncbi:ABC transporter permease [Flavihumibacter petaseus]|uniref:Putative ABC transporter permease protein n=1 Tax=Flavihumibacter petaseus NBRC 106054 TaxID=1220578 RepID=A0A0E9MZA9_9BACT|nr:ABC transporter permease [Flavihumibacter petaseus]GAO43077.1 putative ABC transporter permease protein [Flavihumibacter petaseus NBRC 106054]